MDKPLFSTLPSSFWKKVVARNGCWVWTGHTLPKGYGRVTIAKRRMQTHRLVAEDFYLRIPEDKFVLHTCDNPPCVYPGHLYFGTAADNSADMVRRRRSARGEAHGSSRS